MNKTDEFFKKLVDKKAKAEGKEKWELNGKIIDKFA